MPLNSFVVAAISPERSTLDAVSRALEEHKDVSALWMLNEYPALDRLSQLRDAAGGCVVFLDFSDFVQARAIAAELDRSYPMTTVVAVHPRNRGQDLVELMRLGIRDLIPIPPSSGEIVRVCERAARRLHREPENANSANSLFVFLPARPGCGATTIAAHSAAAAARLSSARTLLIDFDLRLGMTSFLFKLHSEQSVLDALAYSARLDETLWARMLGRRGALDILGSAPFEYGRVAAESGAAAVLDFARKSYGTICVDLPGEMRDYELETIERAREIFLVCTSDLGALHMAKRKADFLQTLDVSSRVSVIMNRADARGGVPIKDVEEILQLPVRFSVPSAEKEIAAATQKAIAIEGRSEIARQLEKIACRMTGGEPSAGEGDSEVKATRRFIEFFSVTPVRDKAVWRR